MMTQTTTDESRQLVFAGLKEIVGTKELAAMAAAGEKGGDESAPGGREMEKDPCGEGNFGRLQAALQKRFGMVELQGLYLRCGRASCKFFVKKYGSEMQVNTTDYRLMPRKRRLDKGLKAAASLGGRLFGKEISVQEEEDCWVWRERNASGMNGPLEGGFGPFFTSGLLQEYLSWLSGGKTFPVKWVEDAALPDGDFNLRIGKQPLE